jgi:hypothetical protein
MWNHAKRLAADPISSIFPVDFIFYASPRPRNSRVQGKTRFGLPPQSMVKEPLRDFKLS